MAFKEGQEVFIKNPGELIGTVIKARPGDKDQPEDQTYYLVQLPDRYYRSTSLEPVDEPSDKLKPYSTEWIEEVNHFVDSGKQLLQDQNDGEARAKFSEAGRKLGWIVPIK
jgi:hypothetical protein